MWTSLHIQLIRLAAIGCCLAAATAAVTMTPHEHAPIRAFQSRSIESTRPITGFALAVHHISNLPLYLRSIDRISETGANSLVIVTPWFQKDISATNIRRRSDRCPTDDQLRALIQRAKERGMHVMLIPIVLLEEACPKEWRGVIKPDDWDAWWESYRRLTDWTIEIANESDVDLISIGSELNSTQKHLARWRQLIEHVRETYQGEITYSANWDQYTKVPFWHLVDAVSVSSYFELERNEPGAPLWKLTNAWAKQRNKLIDFAASTKKPLLLSEVGYPSLPWANAHPWNYVADDDQRADHDLQARCWKSFFDAWSEAITEDDTIVAGFYCYHWDPYHRGDRFDTGYGVWGKPSYDVICDGFKRIHNPRKKPATTQPASQPADQPTSRPQAH